MENPSTKTSMSRRNVIESVLGAIGAGIVLLLASYVSSATPKLPGKGDVKVTKLETFLIKPRRFFLKIHTDAGVVGLRNPEIYNLLDRSVVDW